jgi:hypothetical protein
LIGLDDAIHFYPAQAGSALYVANNVRIIQKVEYQAGKI